MSDDVQVYSPETDDAESLNQLWPLPGDVHGRHLRAQERGEIVYLVARTRDGHIQGSVVVSWNGFEDTGARKAFPVCAEIKHLFVRRAHRGLGVATRLIETAEALIRQRGMTLAGMGVADDNEAARRLYLRLGYKPTGVFDASTYTYVDDDGARQEATELNEAMTKSLQ